MAIYKPSNCTPFLSRIDMTEPSTISCELNTSNENVTGYKLRVLDNNNEIVFEGAQFDKIDEIGKYTNSGLNGSVLTVPFLVEGKALNYNTIGYDKINNAFDIKTGSAFNRALFGNNTSNQPYKWQIILAQGLEPSTSVPGELDQFPMEDKYYDMQITSGTILGSKGAVASLNDPSVRIQSYLSENIYKDYFVELCDNNGEALRDTTTNQVLYRGLIKSYDHTYGNIYCQDNCFTDDQIQTAECFKVYKSSNDPSVIASSSQVAFKTNRTISSWVMDQSYPYYFTSDSKNISYYDSSMTGELQVGMVAMISQQGGGSSANNGIFRVSSITTSLLQTTVKWLRATPGDNWGTLTNTIFYVQNGTYKGQRFQVKTDGITVGQINNTNIQFEPEKAIELYTDTSKTYHKTNDFTRGVIFKNDGIGAYIRPFVGIQDNMRFNYETSSGRKGYIPDMLVDTETWRVYSNGTAFPPLTPNVDKYQIVSFFKTSDENPFYLRESPKVYITIDSKGDETNKMPEQGTIINKRNIVFFGNFVGEADENWVSYQWILYDFTNGTIVSTEKKYNGDISNTFQGLQNQHSYILRLIVEDNYGTIYTINASFVIEIAIKGSNIPLKAEFDCDTQSVLISFEKTGVVVPGEPNMGSENFTVHQSKGNKNDTEEPDNSNTYYDYKVKTPTLVDDEQFVVESASSDRVEYIDCNKIQKATNLSSSSNATVGTYYRYTGTTTSSYIKNHVYLCTAPSPNATFEDRGIISQSEGIIMFVKDNYTPPNDGGAIEYNSTKITEDNSKGYMPAPSTDETTFVSQHVLNPKFEGDIIKYDIDVDGIFSSNGKIYLTVSAPPSVILNNKNERIANNQRYSFVVRCEEVSQIGNTSILLSEKEVDWSLIVSSNPVEKRSEKVKILSAWVKSTPSSTDQDKYDYLDTDLVYDSTITSSTSPVSPLSECRHIRGEVSNSSELIKFPLDGALNGQITIFSDKKYYLIAQANGKNINVISGEDNKWDDNKIWQDGSTTTNFYTQKNANDAINDNPLTGRQYIYNDGNSATIPHNYVYNVVLENYDGTKNKRLGFNLDFTCKKDGNDL